MSISYIYDIENTTPNYYITIQKLAIPDFIKFIKSQI